MAAPAPTRDELRRVAEARGISPTDEDLEAVLAFLAVLEPAFAELERLAPLRPRGE